VYHSLFRRATYIFNFLKQKFQSKFFLPRAAHSAENHLGRTNEICRGDAGSVPNSTVEHPAAPQCDVCMIENIENFRPGLQLSGFALTLHT
jgi:hypothetical protein